MLKTYLVRAREGVKATRALQFMDGVRNLRPDEEMILSEPEYRQAINQLPASMYTVTAVEGPSPIVLGAGSKAAVLEHRMPAIDPSVILPGRAIPEKSREDTPDDIADTMLRAEHPPDAVLRAEAEAVAKLGDKLRWAEFLPKPDVAGTGNGGLEKITDRKAPKPGMAQAKKSGIGKLAVKAKQALRGKQAK